MQLHSSVLTRHQTIPPQSFEAIKAFKKRKRLSVNNAPWELVETGVDCTIDVRQAYRMNNIVGTVPARNDSQERRPSTWTGQLTRHPTLVMW